MDEDDDENVESADQFDADGNPVDDDEMVELQDDSVQGFFTHKGKGLAAKRKKERKNCNPPSIND